jgi:predicted RNase H-like nuclease
MLVEERIYTLYTGKVPQYLSLYREEGLAVQKEILGNMLGYYQVEIGPQNQIVHLWAYKDFQDRTDRRKELAASEAWQTYVKKIRPLVLLQENKILTPTAFSPVPDNFV